MPVAILPRVYLERARSMETVVEASPEAEWTPQDAQDMIRECLALARAGREVLDYSYDFAFQGCSSEGRFLGSGDIGLLVGYRQGLDAAFVMFLAVMEKIRGRVRKVLSPPTRMDSSRLLELDESIRTVQQLRQELQERWPVCTPEEVEEASEEIARAEGEEVSDAFAGMAGISKEELSRRLEEHKRRRHDLGMV